MSGQGILFLKSHLTPVASKGVIFDVSVMVIFQFHLVPERFVAILNWTGKRPFRMVNCLDMLVQATLFTELFIAVGANFRNHIAVQPENY